MDRNGYNPSIVQTNMEKCYICGGYGTLVRHEPLDGIGRREKSKARGLWVCVHPECHELSHKNVLIQNRLRADCQMAAMKHYMWDKERFIKEFGKNYVYMEE